MGITLKKYSVNIQGHATSITLEEVFWQTLKNIAQLENRSIASIITEVDKNMSTFQKKNLSSHIRVYVLEYWMAKANHSTSSAETIKAY